VKNIVALQHLCTQNLIMSTSASTMLLTEFCGKNEWIKKYLIALVL